MLGLKEFTVATDVVKMDEELLAELNMIEERVKDLESRLITHGKELDRLRVDVEFWNTILLTFASEEEEIN